MIAIEDIVTLHPVREDESDQNSWFDDLQADLTAFDSAVEQAHQWLDQRSWEVNESTR